MNTVVNALREIVGDFTFYTDVNGQLTWEFGLMLEYACGVLLVCVCVSAIFKFLNNILK